MAAPTPADRLRAWFLDNVPDNTPPEEVQGLIDVFAANGARSLVSLAEVTDEDVVCARARACCVTCESGVGPACLRAGLRAPRLMLCLDGVLCACARLRWPSAVLFFFCGVCARAPLTCATRAPAG